MIQSLKQSLRNRIIELRASAEAKRFRKERIGIIEAYLQENSIKKIQFGSGQNLLKGWLNTDLTQNADLTYCNLKEKLPFEGNTFQFAFLEHCIGYLTLNEAESFAGELYRIMSPQGLIRIQTPNLDNLNKVLTTDKEAVRFASWYVEKFNLSSYEEHDLGQSVLDDYHQKAFGTVIYNATTLSALLSQAGFRDITICDPIASNNPEFDHISIHHKVIPTWANKFETLTLEARK